MMREYPPLVTRCRVTCVDGDCHHQFVSLAPDDAPARPKVSGAAPVGGVRGGIQTLREPLQMRDMQAH